MYFHFFLVPLVAAKVMPKDKTAVPWRCTIGSMYLIFENNPKAV
jgi:hypothetical protein